ncbi:CAAX protease family protein [Mycolicibacterium confluentis]|uniref:CAAX protease family protein n=1 Tax=Mycolicibacterium confluentis TaxID=28047 RepID=A0A7I7XR23_9MYCO|nr:CAAX protease family protein [Mycolicibacterium confluentis]
MGLGTALVVWSTTAGLQIPGRRHPLIQAALGTALALSVHAPLGVRGAALRSGVRWGALGAAVVTAGVAATTAVPIIQAGMAARDLPTPQWKWLVYEIPLGTVWSEESAYRAALGTLAEVGFGPRAGRLLQATAFGLSHVVDARGAGEPVLGTVLVTGVAGWVFGWLAHRSGSVVASALTHLAINEAGAVAAGWVQRRAV